MMCEVTLLTLALILMMPNVMVDIPTDVTIAAWLEKNPPSPSICRLMIPALALTKSIP
jgi:hypothetical protein